MRMLAGALALVLVPVTQAGSTAASSARLVFSQWSETRLKYEAPHGGWQKDRLFGGPGRGQSRGDGFDGARLDPVDGRRWTERVIG